MIWEGLLQFLAAGFGTMAFSVLFSVPREHYPLCGFIGGAGWFICWGSRGGQFCSNSFYYPGFQNRKHSKEMSGNSVSHCRNFS